MSLDTTTRNATALSRYEQVRSLTMSLAEPLSAEDCAVQSMPDASPVKWHLAHTTWFFETFLLKPHLKGYGEFHPQFSYLFNSYYNTVGERHPRDQRGLLTRPSLSEVKEYRRHVDRFIEEWLETDPDAELLSVFEIGLHHEQQHQELLLTDVKHLLWCNPLRPAYHPDFAEASELSTPPKSSSWIAQDGGIVEVGHRGGRFAYDNESPGHEVLLQPFEIATCSVTNREFREFIEAGGYSDPQWWLSAGWSAVQNQNWKAPLYWTRNDNGQWWHFTLAGMQPIDDASPVCHVSFFEADAYARWSNARLPTEFEWEACSPNDSDEHGFVEQLKGMPLPSRGTATSKLVGMAGHVWEWTGSAYRPYPGYRAPAGALGEYNGKFMCDTFVLRGGSCATPASHYRSTYRNFFAPDTRWQFTGLRLARDLQ